MAQASLALAPAPPADAARPARRFPWHLCALLLITLAGGFLRFAWIDRPALWGDEALTYWRTCGDYRDLLDILQGDGFGPLHYEFYWWLGKGMPIGGGHAIISTSGVSMLPWVMRFLPALAGTLMIPAVYFLAVQIVTRRAALLSAGFAACSAYLMVYSHDAKMYMHLWLFCTIHLGCLLWWLNTRRRIAWLLWIAFGLLMAGTQAASLLLLLAEPVIVLTHRRIHWKTGVLFLAGLLVIGAGPLHYYQFFNKWSERTGGLTPGSTETATASREDWYGNSGLGWVEMQTRGRTGPDLALAALSAHLWSFETPPSRPELVKAAVQQSEKAAKILAGDDEKAKAALREHREARNGVSLGGGWRSEFWSSLTVRLSGIFWTALCLLLLTLAVAALPWPRWLRGQRDTDPPRQNWWRIALWLGVLIILPCYFVYCRSMKDFAAPSAWTEAIAQPADASLQSQWFFFGLDQPLRTRWTPQFVDWLTPHWPLDKSWLPVFRSWLPLAVELSAGFIVFTGLLWLAWRGSRRFGRFVWKLVCDEVQGIPYRKPGDPPPHFPAWWLRLPSVGPRIIRPILILAALAIAGAVLIEAHEPFFPDLPRSLLHPKELAASAAAASPYTTGTPIPYLDWGGKAIDWLNRPKVLGPIVLILPAAAWLLCAPTFRRRAIKLAQLALLILGLYLLCAGVFCVMTELHKSADAAHKQWHSIWQPRYVAIIWPALAIAVCALLLRLPTRPLRYTVIALFLAINVNGALGRMFGDSEPAMDRMSADVLADQKPADTTRTFLLSQGWGGVGPGQAGLGDAPGKYYLSVLTGRKLSPAEFASPAFLANYRLRFTTSAREIAARVQQSTPAIGRVVVWERQDLSDNPLSSRDEILAALGPGWRSIKTEPHTNRLHWAWHSFSIDVRREYVRE